MVDEVVTLVNCAENVDELVASLLERGLTVEGQNINNFIYRLKEIYLIHNNRKDPSHQMQPLPGRTVSVNGTSYYIHGLIHPAIGNPVSEEYRLVLRRATANWSLLCEDGFKEDFFPEADIFGEVNFLKLNTFKSYIRTFPRLLRVLGSLAVDNLLNKKPPIVVQEIKTIDDLREVRVDLFRGYFPEPFGMNALLRLYPDSTRVKRYIFEAENAIGYASEKNLKELHIIVGCAHEMPLEYLLSNPNKIQDFKTGIKWK